MLVVCAGTATDIGKTWVGGRVLTDLRARGVTVSARKPAQSHDPSDAEPLDSDVLAAATGETSDEVCRPHRTYPVPMAPPMAADVLGMPSPTMAELLGELAWPDPAPSLCWLELVGGPRSPVAADADGVDLAAALRPDLVVLVADAGLGTINAVALSSAPFHALGLSVVVLLNRYDADSDLHRRNLAWLDGRGPSAVITDVAALADHLQGAAEPAG